MIYMRNSLNHCIKNIRKHHQKMKNKQTNLGKSRKLDLVSKSRNP
jgi:hypothetical protein